MAHADTRSPSCTPHRTQRALSISAETRVSRDSHYEQNGLCLCPASPPFNAAPLLSPFIQLSHDIRLPPVNDLDLYKRPISQPLTASGHDPALQSGDTTTADGTRRSKKDQLSLKSLHTGRLDKADKLHAKQERKQKREEYKQMYQSQYDYERQMEERRTEKRQQRSLPIHPSSTSSASGGDAPTDHAGRPQSLAPANEMYYHSSRHYYRPSRPHQQNYCQDPSLEQPRVGSLSSFTSAKYSQNKTSAEKLRSFSLKSQSTKSMNDLRPWSGVPPQSPAYDYPSGYDSDDTAMSQDWGSLMDTLHSPSTHQPIDSPAWDSSSKDDAEPDSMDASFSSMSLASDNSKSGNGRYLLVLGANGRTGLELVRQGLERNYRVTAFVRDDRVLLDDSTLRKNQNLLIVHGFPTCQMDLDRCVEGQDVVVNVIGVNKCRGSRGSVQRLYKNTDTSFCRPIRHAS
ncbi:unnamed protein product [Mortierella alpina]